MSEAEKRRKDRQELYGLLHAIEPAKNEDIARRAISIADYWLIKAENQAKHIQDLEARNSKQSTIEPELIRCKDCKWWGYDDDDGAVRVCHAAKHGHMSSNWSIMIYRTHKGDFYCADAERKEGEAE